MVKTFVKARRLPADLVTSIMSQFSSLGREEVSASEVFDKLSNPLQVEVARVTTRKLVEKVSMMADCKSNFLDALGVLLRVSSGLLK